MKSLEKHIEDYFRALRLCQARQWDAAITTAKRSLTDPSLPRQWQVEDCVIVCSATDDWEEAEVRMVCRQANRASLTGIADSFVTQRFREAAEAVYNTSRIQATPSQKAEATLRDMRSILDQIKAGQDAEPPEETKVDVENDSHDAEETDEDDDELDDSEDDELNDSEDEAVNREPDPLKVIRGTLVMHMPARSLESVSVHQRAGRLHDTDRYLGAVKRLRARQQSGCLCLCLSLAAGISSRLKPFIGSSRWVGNGRYCQIQILSVSSCAEVMFKSCVGCLPCLDSLWYIPILRHTNAPTYACTPPIIYTAESNTLTYSFSLYTPSLPPPPTLRPLLILLRPPLKRLPLLLLPLLWRLRPHLPRLRDLTLQLILQPIKHALLRRRWHPGLNHLL